MSFNNRKTFLDDKADKVWVNQFGQKSESYDITGTLVKRNNHSENGWHVDHIKPLARYGSNDLSNLQVLAAAENRKKDDNYPTWTDTKGKTHTQKGS